jgi:hypothetical protein
MRTFVPWVEPIAARLQESRAKVADFARSAPVHIWEKPSPNEGWTNKDVLAHLATGHWVLQRFLASITSGATLEAIDVDAGNAERVAERRDWSVERLITEVEDEGDETQDLLARLEGPHEAYRRENAPRTFSEILRSFPEHEYHHLRQLQPGIEVTSHD